jgi:hypothetical protein
LSTDAPEQTAEIGDDRVMSGPHPSYTPDVLREQIAILRRESAVRAKAENEITGEFEEETARILKESEKALTATRAKYDNELQVTRREYQKLLEKADAFLAAEQKKLNDARDARAKALNAGCARILSELQDDEGFDKLRENESRKNRGQQPKAAASKSEKELARSLAQLDDAVAQSVSLLTTRGVKDVPEGGDEPFEAAPADTPLAAVAQAAMAATEQVAAIADLPSVKKAFSGGLQGSVIGGPIVGGLVAAAALFFLMPGDIGVRAGIAGGAAALIIGAGIGAGMWYVGGRRQAARAELVALHQSLLQTVAAGKLLAEP